MPWCRTPLVRRSSSGLLTSRIAMPRSPARFTASATRSSVSMPSATYSAVAGTSARSASATGLRPTSSSGASTGDLRRAAVRPAAAALRCAGCPGRSSAGGVGPLPFSPRRRWPPEPTTAPFFEPGLRRAPRRWELPAIEAPPRTRGGVLDRDAGPGELVTDGVRRGVVPTGAGALPLLQRDGDQSVHHLAQPGATAVRPLWSERVQAEHAEHRAYRGERAGYRRVVAGGQRRVALADHVVHGGQRGRRTEVVIHRGDELRAQRTGPWSGADDLGGTLHEALEPPVRRRGLRQRLGGVVDHRTVVRRHQVVPQLDRPHEGDQLGDEQRVAERLAHLLPAHGEQGVVQPVPGEAVSGRPRLGDLVLVVREDEVGAAAVDVEGLAEVPGGHRRALQVPARAARPPRRLPLRLAGLGALPQGEVQRVALAATLLARAHLVDLLPGQRAVLRVRPHVEPDVAAGGVRVALVDEPLHQRDHLGYVPGGARLDRRRQAAEHVVRPGERTLVAGRDRPPRHPLRGGHPENFVVDVGHVAAERHLQAAVLEVPPQHVEVDAGPDMPDMRWCLYGRPAQVDTHPPLDQGLELAHRPRAGVMQPQTHPAIVVAARSPSAAALRRAGGAPSSTAPGALPSGAQLRSSSSPSFAARKKSAISSGRKDRAWPSGSLESPMSTPLSTAATSTHAMLARV